MGTLTRETNALPMVSHHIHLERNIPMYLGGCVLTPEGQLVGIRVHGASFGETLLQEVGGVRLRFSVGVLGNVNLCQPS